MAMQFPPEVERWRSTVAKYFPAELVDKALWTIQHESGGNPNVPGDGGAARGLFQIQDNRNFANRPDAAYLDNPENNIKYAAQQLGAAKGDFSAWGEGSTYQGKPFGAFGNNQFPGSPGGGSQMTDPEQATYEGIIAQIDAMMRSAPTPGTDEYLDWLSELSMLTSAAKQMRPSSQDTDPNDTATQGFQNKVNELQSSLAYDSTNLSRAIADIDRFLGAQEESRARADTIMAGQDMVRRWGTPEGKTGYSLADLGAGFESAGKVSGVDTSKPFINYTGTIRIDPEADMRRYDQSLGATGTVPGVPGMITQSGQVPGAPELDMGAGLVSSGPATYDSYSGTGATYSGPTYANDVPGMYDQNPDYVTGLTDDEKRKKVADAMKYGTGINPIPMPARY